MNLTSIQVLCQCCWKFWVKLKYFVCQMRSYWLRAITWSESFHFHYSRVALQLFCIYFTPLNLNPAAEQLSTKHPLRNIRNIIGEGVSWLWRQHIYEKASESPPNVKLMRFLQVIFVHDEATRIKYLKRTQTLQDIFFPFFHQRLYHRAWDLEIDFLKLIISFVVVQNISIVLYDYKNSWIYSHSARCVHIWCEL